MSTPEWSRWATRMIPLRTSPRSVSQARAGHVETISAFDTPAYTGEKVPEDLLPLLVSPEWVEERKLR
jgi:hypothetical protein